MNPALTNDCWPSANLHTRLLRHARAAAILLCTFLIRFYQAFVRPHLIGGCKFHPTCSEYALAVLNSHGLARGIWLSIKRVSRCHPFACGGYDPPPQPPSRSTG